MGSTTSIKCLFKIILIYYIIEDLKYDIFMLFLNNRKKNKFAKRDKGIVCTVKTMIYNFTYKLHCY